MFKFQIFPDPLDAKCTLHHDNGFVGVGTPSVDDEGRQGQAIMIPDDVPNQNGAELVVEKSGYVRMSVRGFLVLDPNTKVARLQVDDYNLVPDDVVVEPPTGEMNPNANPLEIIHYVYNNTSPNLSTAAGCGKFTEDCCKALHDMMHPGWGHVKKNPGQNQFNGHAVDALMLLVPSGQTAPAIYDIIQNSASFEAKPVFNYAGPVDNALWYYPAAPLGTKSLESVTTWHKGKK